MIRKSFHIILISFVLITLVSCENNNDHDSSTENVVHNDFDITEARSRIQELNKQFTAAHITGDTAFLNNIFTIDARVFPPNSDVVTGREAIALLNLDWIGYGIKEFHEETTELYGDEKYLIDEGTYFVSYLSDSVAEKGKYINIWKNVSGDWKIYSNIWNSSDPKVAE